LVAANVATNVVNQFISDMRLAMLTVGVVVVVLIVKASSLSTNWGAMISSSAET
jgi:ABC-type antimicrobial peptide transport system permease subunit